MQKLLVFLSMLLMAFGTSVFAGYACPPESSSGGGWLPPECVVAKKAICADCGVVEAVNVVETEDASGIGAAAGAVAGGAAR